MYRQDQSACPVQKGADQMRGYCPANNTKAVEGPKWGRMRYAPAPRGTKARETRSTEGGGGVGGGGGWGGGGGGG